MAQERRKFIQKKEVTMSLPVVKTPSWLQGFTNFIREQGVVGLAVGFILGFASKNLIDSLVNNVINPLAGVLYGGGGSLASKTWCLKSVGNKCTNPIGYGEFLNQLISFLILVAVVYLIVKKLKLEKLDKKKDS